MSDGAAFERFLRGELRNRARRDTFDMVDGPEIAAAECHPRLQRALSLLQSTVTGAWEDADRRAVRDQRNHRRLALTAIVAGTFSIILAIAQLASVEVGPLEAVTFFLALLAVATGLSVRTDRRWLTHRHLAERLRMLKFRAIGQLLCLDDAGFIAWLEAEMKKLALPKMFEAWEREERVEPAPPPPAHTPLDSGLIDSVVAYYLVKRVLYQARYFERRHGDYEKEARVWRWFAFPLFIGSVIFVAGHFALEWISGHLSARSRDAIEWVPKTLVAYAAILPVVAAGIRAWLGAFELPRSASLFDAKRRALTGAAGHLAHDRGDVALTQAHINGIEHFLEDEHREWLRLLSDAEWYL